MVKKTCTSTFWPFLNHKDFTIQKLSSGIDTYDNVLFIFLLKFNQTFTVLDKIENLILTERIETIIPLAYISIMTMAYYGPNANIMGSVKLQIWHHQNVIEDFEAFVINVSLLFGADLISLIINGFLIWKVCNINPLKVVYKIQKRYWFVMMFTEAYMLGAVSISLHSSFLRSTVSSFYP